MVLIFLLVGVAAISPLYENSRSFISGLMTGYEGSDYEFPTKMCLNTTTQIAINDALIAIAMFAPLNNDAIVAKEIEILQKQLTNSYTSCQLSVLFSEIETNLQEVGLVRWTTRLWWNSILIYRSWYEALNSCQRYLYETCGKDIGTITRYVFTPLS